MPIKKIFSPFRAELGQSWDLAAKTSVIVGLFVLPLLAFTWTSDWWEIHKSMWLLFFVTVGWGCALVAMIRRRKTYWTWNRLDFLVLFFGLVSIISMVFSVRPWQSLAGISGTQSGTVIVTLSLIGLYLLIGQVFHQANERRWVWWALAGGLAVSLLFQMAQISDLSFLAMGFPADDPFFSLLTNARSDVAVLAGLFGSSLLLWWPQAKERWQRLGIVAGVILSWLLLLFYGAALGWAAFAIGMLLVVLIQSRSGSKADMKFIFMVLALAAAGIIAQLTGLSNRSGLVKQPEVNLDQRTSLAIAGQTMLHRPVLGSGPETWYQDFVKYRPTSFNQSSFWNVRFVKSSAAWWQVVATLGIIGTITLGSIAGLCWWWIWRRVWSTPSPELAGLALVTTAFVFIGFFTTWSLPLLVWWWVALAMSRAWLENQKPHSRPIGGGSVIALAAFVVVALGLWWPTVQTYAGAVMLQKVQPAIARQEALPKIRQRLQKLLAFNPQNTEARVLLANGFLVDGLLQAQAGKTTEAQPLLQQALSTMDQAVANDRLNPQVYEQYNNLLNSMLGLEASVVQRAVTNFAALQKLEPASPVHDLGHGQVVQLQRTTLLQESNVTEAQKQQAAQMLQQSTTDFNAALSKKAEYTQARLSRAQAYMAAEQYEQALADYRTVNTAAQLPEVWRDMGVALSKLKKNDEALAAFNQAITLNAADVQTYVDLADHWLAVGDKDQARKALDQGLKSVPNDPTLTAKKSSIK